MAWSEGWMGSKVENKGSKSLKTQDPGGTLLAVQGLRLHTCTARGTGSIPRKGTKTSEHSQKRKKKERGPSTGSPPWRPCEICQSFSCAQLFATPWAIAHQAPLPIKHSRQEYWSRQPFPSPGIKPYSPALQADSLPSVPPGKPPETSKLLRTPRYHAKKEIKGYGT